MKLGTQKKQISAQLSDSQVADIKQAIATVDSENFRGRLGPYNVYKDTSVELYFRISDENGGRKFSVSNPWPGHQMKPFPPALRRLICNLDAARSNAEGEHPDKWCTA